MTIPTTEYDPRVAAFFNETYDAVVATIPFNEKWRWQMSLRGAIHDLSHKLRLASGTTVKTIDDLGRKVIFIGTPLGAITLFAYPLPRNRTKIVYEVPEVFCEQGLFQRASDRLDLSGLQHVMSSLFAQATQEVAVELVG